MGGKLGELFDEFGVLGILANQRCPVGQFKVGEIEAGRHGATAQAEAGGIVHGGPEPATGVDRKLKPLTDGRIGAQSPSRVSTLAIENMDGQRRTDIKMPEFVGFQPVQAGALTAL